MDRQGPPNWPRYQLTRGLIGLDNKKDTMTGQEGSTMRPLPNAQWDRPASGNTEQNFCLAGQSAPTGLAIVHWIGY